MKTFKIGNDRSLKLIKKNDCISIEDNGTKKAAHFTPARWASFLQCLDLIKLSEGEDSRCKIGILAQVNWGRVRNVPETIGSDDSYPM